MIVDTNIMFSILLRDKTKERRILFLSDDKKFFSCKFAIVELFKLKEKIMKYSQLSEEDVLTTFYSLIKAIEFYNEDLISTSSLRSAYELCSNIDEKDTVFVALTLELEGYLWTGDKKLKNGLLSKGFNRFFSS